MKCNFSKEENNQKTYLSFITCDTLQMREDISKEGERLVFGETDQCTLDTSFDCIRLIE